MSRRRRLEAAIVIVGLVVLTGFTTNLPVQTEFCDGEAGSVRLVGLRSDRVASAEAAGQGHCPPDWRAAMDVGVAAGVLVFALLPGALYIWAFERLVGRWGIGLADRLLRFVGVSAIFHALIAPFTYWIWARYWESGRVSTGQSLPLALWLLPLLYVAIPALFGSAVAVGHSRSKQWARWFTGPDPAPRAWDYLFQGHPDGWIRCKLRSQVWIGGAFADRNGRRSYVAGYPEPADLYLAQAADVDPDTGEFRLVDGRPSLRDSGLLIRWDEIEYLAFIDA